MGTKGQRIGARVAITGFGDYDGHYGGESWGQSGYRGVGRLRWSPGSWETMMGTMGQKVGAMVGTTELEDRDGHHGVGSP